MPERAIDLFQQIDTPNEFLYVLFYKACSQTPTSEVANLLRRVVSQMPNKFHSNVYITTTLIDALMRCGDVAQARALFDRSSDKVSPMYGALMKGTRLSSLREKNVRLYSSGYIDRQMPSEAIDLFRRVEHPDEAAYVLLCKACALVHTSEAFELTRNLASHIPEQFKGSVKLSTALIHVLMKSGDMATAQSVYDQSNNKSQEMQAVMMKGRRERVAS